MILYLINLAVADSGKSVPPGSGFIAMLPFVVICLIFYFLLIRPQQKKEKEHQKMLKELKKGDSILTNGGIYATIMEVYDDYLIVRVTPSEIKMKIAKNSVANLLEEKKTPKAKDR
jgi:preprotein translocase subunit YajC